MLQHEEERRRGIHVDHFVPPPPPEVLPEEQDEEVAYQAVLEMALRHVLEAKRIEEDAKWVGLDRALALSAAGDFVHTPRFVLEPPPLPPPTVKPKEEPWPSQKRSSPPPSWSEEKYE
ncbi:hypothetical protein D1007_57996 [Hordeum vulgare]|nr:hypothetical protein D1007_57996 [Hordeum vulgare]